MISIFDHISTQLSTRFSFPPAKSRFSILAVIILPKQTQQWYLLVWGERLRISYLFAGANTPHPRRNWYYCAFRIILFAIWHILCLFSSFIWKGSYRRANRWVQTSPHLSLLYRKMVLPSNVNFILAVRGICHLIPLMLVMSLYALCGTIKR